MTARWHVIGLGRWATPGMMIEIPVSQRPIPVKMKNYFHRSRPMDHARYDDRNAGDSSAKTGDMFKF